MSLINRMLQDLDARQAGGAEGGMLPGVRSTAARRGRMPVFLLSVTVLALAVAGGGYWWVNQSSPAPGQIGGAAVPAPAPVSAQAPQPTVTAQAPVPVAPPAAVPAPEPAVAQPPAPPVQAAPATPPPLREAAVIPPPEKVKAQPPVSAASGKGTVPRAEAPSPRIEKTPRGNSGDDRATEAYRQGVEALSRGRNGEGIETLKSALRYDPGLLPARQLLAKVLVEQNALDEARHVLRDGLKHDPKQIQWAMTLARLEIDRNEPLAAWAAMEPSLLYATNDGEFLAFAGAIRQRLGKPGEAADYFRNALRLGPSNGRWWIGLAMALNAEGHRPEAKEAYRRAIATGSLPPNLVTHAEQKIR